MVNCAVIIGHLYYFVWESWQQNVIYTVIHGGPTPVRSNFCWYALYSFCPCFMVYRSVYCHMVASFTIQEVWRFLSLKFFFSLMLAVQQQTLTYLTEHFPVFWTWLTTFAFMMFCCITSSSHKIKEGSLSDFAL